jgi:hypothetical protein
VGDADLRAAIISTLAEFADSVDGTDDLAPLGLVETAGGPLSPGPSGTPQVLPPPP